MAGIRTSIRPIIAGNRCWSVDWQNTADARLNTSAAGRDSLRSLYLPGGSAAVSWAAAG
jgi:hypothetical protein